MTKDTFIELIQRAEFETLDFKADYYDLSRSRNKFIKDIVAMANTPRDHSAYIVLGVRWTPDSGTDVVGMTKQIDDTELQDAFGSCPVQPTPRFTYTPLIIENKSVGVIEIPIQRQGPYTPVKDFAAHSKKTGTTGRDEGLQAGAIYYRRGTQNTRAIGTELIRIVNWFPSSDIGTPESGAVPWPQFVEAVSGFAEDLTFLLAVDRMSPDMSGPISGLGLAPWRTVIDFDPNSESSGLLRLIGGTLSRHRVIHRVVRGQRQIHSDPGTHWFFARGLSGLEDTLCGGDFRVWLRTYKRELGRQLEYIAGSVSPSAVVAVVLWSEVDLHRELRTLLEEIYGAFGELVEIVVVCDHTDQTIGNAVESIGAKLIVMSRRSLVHGLAVHYADLTGESDDGCVLPSASGAPIKLERSDWLWIREDVELIHRSMGMSGDDDAGAYRRGADISWRNLQLRHDCDRGVTASLRARVESDLRRRQTVRVNLYHAPGSGGTTVGRRIAWDLRNAYPVGILHGRVARGAAEKIEKVAALTESSVLIVVDGGQHSEREIDDLYEFLKANHTPVVLLQVLRRFRAPQLGGARQFRLETALTNDEADRFRVAYTDAVPGKRNELLEVAAHISGLRRSAFFFGLTAFEQNFRGLQTYVRERMVGITPVQLRILIYIAIAHYYGQQSIPAQAFAVVLGLPRSRNLRIAEIFSGKTVPAIDLLAQSGGGEWRTAHQFIALEIMRQAYAVSGEEQRIQWKQALSRWGKDFADFCDGSERPASDRLLELVRRVFIYRDNAEVLGTERAALSQFAQFIEDIPSSHGKVDVLRHLAHRFPYEPHIHAHLGRLLSLSGEHTEALQHVDYAISLQRDDHLLHHMRGMVLRQSIRAQAANGVSILHVIEEAREATSSFEEARRLRPDEEHGYVSEVQMLIYLVDEAGRGKQDVMRTVLAHPSTDAFLRNALEKAEDLLDRVYHLHAGEAPSRYVIECRARIQRFYGDFQAALQTWDSLMSRSGVAKPPVRRQIIWTILRRHDSSWDTLSNQESDRIRSLLEQNLDEDVGDSTSLRLWLRAVRHSQTLPSLDSVIERVSYWKANTGALYATYYLYVLHTLRALDGSSQASADAERALDECRALARFRRDRTRSFEWIGSGDGIRSLVHQSRLGTWTGDFWDSVDPLVRLQGRISEIGGPEKGIVEMIGGIKAFFVPAKSGFDMGRDENVLVDCYLGFSFDGPRAWQVDRVGDWAPNQSQVQQRYRVVSTSG